VASILTIQGELLVPLAILHGKTAEEVHDWLRVQGLFPRQVSRCRWRLDAERLGYVLSYEVRVPREEPA
jgi:hypothetical protein